MAKEKLPLRLGRPFNESYETTVTTWVPRMCSRGVVYGTKDFTTLTQMNLKSRQANKPNLLSNIDSDLINFLFQKLEYKEKKLMRPE